MICKLKPKYMQMYYGPENFPLKFFTNAKFRFFLNYTCLSWKRVVWDKAWGIEQSEWQGKLTDNPNMDLIRLVSQKVEYSTWWSLADKEQQYMRRCEVMIKLLCHSSLLRGDDNRFKRNQFGEKCCIMCDHTAYENMTHMVMQCDGHNDKRRQMYEEINQVQHGINNLINFGVLLGGYIDGWSFEEMSPIWMISSTYISQMYYEVINNRKTHTAP